MSAYPRKMLYRWDELENTPFDAGSDLARSFQDVPVSEWDGLYYKGKSALAWAIGFAGLPLSRRLSENQLQWVEYLLAAGANPRKQFRKPGGQKDRDWGRPSFGTLSEWAWESPEATLLDMCERHGMELFPKGRWVSASCVVRKGRIDWWKAFLESSGSAFPQRLHDVLSGFSVLVSKRGAFEKEVLRSALEKGWGWSDIPQGWSQESVLLDMWEWALEDPSVLPWACDAWDAMALAQPPAGWRDRLGVFFIYLNPEADPSAVVEALEARLSPELRFDWAPNLLMSRSDYRPGYCIPNEAWLGVKTIIDWGVRWGMPPKARTSEGVPWALWVLRQAVESNRARFFDSPAHSAWVCLNALIMAGASVDAKALSKKKPRITDTRPTLEVNSKLVTVRNYLADPNGFRMRSDVVTGDIINWPARFQKALVAKRLTSAWESQAEVVQPPERKPRF